ncbi:MAG: metal-dependent hydrolase [Candidatus Hodarchaeota archaeon]
MPDWLTHVLVGWGIFNLLTLQKSDIEPFKPAIIVGSVLPDLWYARMIIEPLLDIDLTWYLYILHTPIGSILMSLLIGLIFLKDNVWKLGTLFLMIGAIIHLILDVMLKHINGGHFLLIPFSLRVFELDIFWPESFAFLLIALIFWGITYLLTIKMKCNPKTKLMC